MDCHVHGRTWPTLIALDNWTVIISNLCSNDILSILIIVICSYLIVILLWTISWCQLISLDQPYCAHYFTRLKLKLISVLLYKKLALPMLIYFTTRTKLLSFRDLFYQWCIARKGLLGHILFNEEGNTFDFLVLFFNITYLQLCWKSVSAQLFFIMPFFHFTGAFVCCRTKMSFEIGLIKL